MRVIAGSTKRLLLKTLDGLDIRPTTDGIKETLFNMLQPDLPDCTSLNLFSGSGTIGIEALSRGIGLAVMTENNPRASECIRENLARTKPEGRAMAMGCDMITGLKRLGGKNYRFDIVFMDPPCHHEYEWLVLDYLSRSPMATEDTLIIIETFRGIDFGWPEESGWYMIKSKEHKTNKHVFAGRGEQMRTAVYPGSFDPVTLGYCDITERIVKTVDKLIIGVFNNKAKYPLLSAQERANMLKEVTASLPNMEIQSFEGLLIDFVRGSYADIVIRGLRAVTGSEHELQVAQTNRAVTSEIDTIFLTINLKYPYLSSSIVREIAEYEGDISEFPHPVTAARAREKLEERRRLI